MQSQASKQLYTQQMGVSILIVLLISCLCLVDRSAGHKPDAQLIQIPGYGCRDDHEIANDSWSTGAENHQPDTEGDYQDRTQNAIRAYLEWVPIRNLKSEKDSFADAFRVFQFGDLATLVRPCILALSLSQAWFVWRYYCSVQHGPIDNVKGAILQAYGWPAMAKWCIADNLRCSRQHTEMHKPIWVGKAGLVLQSHPHVSPPLNSITECK